MFHVPDSSGTLLSPDYTCGESNEQYDEFTIEPNFQTGNRLMTLYGGKHLQLKLS